MKSHKEQQKLIKSPLKAIRAHCLMCCGWSAQDVKDCEGPLCIGDKGKCALHPYRFGKGRRSGVKSKLSPIKAIAKNCLWCCCGSFKERRLCPGVLCPIHPFREGKNPYVSEKKKESAKNAARCSPRKLKKAT